MIDLTALCYSALAPISVLCEIILLYGFLRLKQIKHHPEIMIFWQCLSQLILDIHWFTGIPSIKNSLSDAECQFLGAFCIYFYFLSWDYTLFLSLEIYFKIVKPHETNYKTRRIWYHSISHLTSFVIFLVLMLSNDNNGNSIMTTCFVQRQTVYELIVFIPAVVHFPICIAFTVYIIWLSHNTFYANYLKYHMRIVIAFSLSWMPIAIIHGLNYQYFDLTIPTWFLLFGVIMGGPSGFIVFVARMQQKGLLLQIINSCKRRNVSLNSLVENIFPDPDSQEINNYSILFDTVTTKGLIDILIGLSQFFGENPAHKNSKNYTKNITILSENSRKKISVKYYNINNFKKIIEKCGVNFFQISESLNIDQNIIDLDYRCKSIGGRSGAFFYFTADNQYILKTINSDELYVLNYMIEDYTERVTSESSILAKILGVFKIKVDKSSSCRVVLMENLACRLENPLIFDMKGSTADRKASETVYLNFDDMIRGKVYKDVDFFASAHGVSIEKSEFCTLLNALTLDTKLLEQYMIMDYSLLVLIEDASYLKGSMITAQNYFRSGKFIIFLGIIDYLQTYNTKKKIENRYKTLKLNHELLSAIPPKPYKKRFIHMVKSMFEDLEIN